MKRIVLFATFSIIAGALFLLRERQVPVAETSKVAVEREEVVQKVAKRLPASTVSIPKQSTISKIKNCYEESCDYPDSDPREYYLSVGQHLKEEAQKMYEDVLRDGTISKSIERDAISLLSVRDGHVKKQGVYLLSTQPPSPEAFEAMVAEVFQYHDSVLIPLAMVEMKKYLGEEYRKDTDAVIISSLENGSLLVREQVAKGIYPFISKDNVRAISKMLTKFPVSSNSYKYLSAAIRKFRNM